MRILCITSSYPKYPGDTTAPFIESMTQALAERGHHIDVVLPARADLRPASLPGVRFHPYRYAPWERLSIFGYAESLRADVALRYRAYLVAPLAVASGALKCLRLARSGGYDVLHAHWVVPSGAMALPAARMARLPLFVSLHGSDVFLSEKLPALRWAARRVFGRAAGVTACSEDLAHRSQGLGARAPITTPYGVDTSLFQPGDSDREAVRRRLGIGPRDPLVLAVGRLVHKKGFEILVDALPHLLAEHPAARIVIAGRGDLEATLNQRAGELGVASHLLLVGNVPRQDLPAYYASADVVAVPSVKDAAGNVDGLPNVLLEAMSAGAPIVASAVAGIPQALRHEKEGLLVPEADAKALAGAVANLLSCPQRGQELGRAARDRALQEFDWDGVGKRLEDLFRSVARER